MGLIRKQQIEFSEIRAYSRVPSNKAAITNTSEDTDENEIVALSHLKGYGNTNSELTHLGLSQIQGTNKIVIIGSSGAEAMSISEDTHTTVASSRRPSAETAARKQRPCSISRNPLTATIL